MSVQHIDISELREAVGIFKKAAMQHKVAFTQTAPPPPPMTATPPPGDPAAQGGDPAMMQGGQAPMPADPAAMQGGAPMPPEQAAPAPQGAVTPQLEQMLTQLAGGMTDMSNKVVTHDTQLQDMTTRLLKMEQELSSLRDGLKSPAGFEEQPVQGQPIA